METNVVKRYFVAGSTLMREYLLNHPNLVETTEKSKKKKGELEFKVNGIDKDRHISMTSHHIFLVNKGNVAVIDTIPEETKVGKVIDYTDTIISESRLTSFIKGE